MTDYQILKRAIAVFGVDAQRNMLIEEIGELLNALGKYPRARATSEDIIEELADVVIMCEQIAFSISFDDYLKKRDEKLTRLEYKLKKH